MDLKIVDLERKKMPKVNSMVIENGKRSHIFDGTYMVEWRQHKKCNNIKSFLADDVDD